MTSQRPTCWKKQPVNSVAFLAYEHRPDLLAHPSPTIDPSEGWIFVPSDGLRTSGDELISLLAGIRHSR
ncbi:hypothetical protein XJ28_24605 [Pseudomonas syringae pv. tomato]|nr:hypothetical protein XJ28_24605 [Pseudomonas syringae pv. tomato]QBI61566.1 hypothetical protein EIZ61_08795 [Pseudomonas syringae]TES62042.1 hypothetical protein E2N90_30330 [Pseudomonas syringae pv. tomato]